MIASTGPSAARRGILERGSGGPAVEAVLRAATKRLSDAGIEAARRDARLLLAAVVPGGAAALWLQTDEGEDVTLKFRGNRFGLPPRAFARLGERLGQGQRCAYLRLTRIAEVQIPVNGKVDVDVGDTVLAGIDMIGQVPAPR